MHLEIDEYEIMHSARRRYVNMTKKFLPDISDFDVLIQFIRELHSIHTQERKIINNHLAEVTEAKDLADESHCSPGRFFKHRSTLQEFKRLFHRVNNKIFNQEAKNALAAAYATEPRIARIDVGYHINRTGKENGKQVLALLEQNPNNTRITFTDGNILDINHLDDLTLAREKYNAKWHRSVKLL